MTGITHSSIQPWLDFDGIKLPASLPSCQNTRDENGNITESTGDCAEVCGSANNLWNSDYPRNVGMCGLWVTLTTNDHYPKDLLTRFGYLGLNASNASQVYAANDSVSTILMKTYETQIIGSIPQGACSAPMLWSAPVGKSSHSTLYKCMNTICIAPSVNPDIGGIEVSLSTYAAYVSICISVAAEA